jgi:hypothetical protein
MQPSKILFLEKILKIKKHLAYRQVLDICGGATGDRTPGLMTARFIKGKVNSDS